MGQSRRQRSEGEEALSLLGRLLGVLDAEEQPLEQVHGHREPLTHQVGELVGSEHEEP